MRPCRPLHADQITGACDDTSTLGSPIVPTDPLGAFLPFTRTGDTARFSSAEGSRLARMALAG